MATPRQRGVGPTRPKAIQKRHRRCARAWTCSRLFCPKPASPRRRPLRSFPRSQPKPMSRVLSRWAVAAALAGVAPLASGCDFLDDIQSWNKKPLTGERKPVFPDGVPGVATGVPADVVKGYRAPAVQLDPAAAAAEAAAATAEPTRPRPKPQTAK